MEPQLEGCGKVWQWQGSVDVDGLQWSRNLRVAESDEQCLIRRDHSAASMEPQLEGCGKARKHGWNRR